MIVAFLLGLTVTASGCGQSTTPVERMVEVKGTITFKGKPIDDGMVRFLPTDPQKTSQSASPIIKGEFRVQTSPGEKRVEVTAGKTRIPKLYEGAKSTLRVEIPDGGKTDLQIDVPAK